MAWIGVAAAAVLIIVVFIDAFEVMILPRRIRHGFRLAPLYYRSAWVLWWIAARLLPAGRWRNGFLSVFGPLSLFGLLSGWAVGPIAGFSFAPPFAHPLGVLGAEVAKRGQERPDVASATPT